MRRWLGLLGAGILALVTGCSGTPTARHVVPPLPSGWKTVTYHGVGIDVPGNWVVEPWRGNCGVSSPTVFIGPEGISVLFCPEFMTGAAEVILGARSVGTRPVVPETLNGLNASERRQQAVYHGHLSGTLTNIFVRLPTVGFSISLSVGESSNFPGGAPGRAEQIVGTIHLVRHAASTGSESAALPPGVLPKATMLAQHANPRPEITTQAKLVSLADLTAVDPDLTQCQFRGCAPGQLVWLVLQKGPPGSFPHSCPAGTGPAACAGDWSLFPVDAVTGVGRGDSEIGATGNLATSAWAKLTDLAPQN